jgi:hypothetical protein
MSVQFEIRALAEAPYRDVVELLDRAGNGDRSSFDVLRRRARGALDDPGLQVRNAYSGVLHVWRAWLDEVSPAPGAVAKLAEIVVAACCLPEFQLADLAGPQRAATLAVLGDDDGGLFGVLTERAAWFEPWLVMGLQQRAERHGYGRPMFRMAPDDRARLAGELVGLAHHGGEAASGVHLREALARLRALLQRIDDTPGWTGVVCETG